MAKIPCITTKEMFIDKGFAFYNDLEPEEKNNVQAGRTWNDYGEKSEE